MRALLGVDLKDRGSEALVDAASAWAKRVGATVDVAFADTFELLLFGTGDPRLDPLLAREWRRILDDERAGLDKLVQRLPVEVRGVPLLLDGSPADTIAKRGSEGDLVIVGTHGRTGLNHLWLGSVAERVVRLATRPVLVLRGPPAPSPRALVALDPEEPMAPLLRAIEPFVTALGAKVDGLAVIPPITALLPTVDTILLDQLRVDEQRREELARDRVREALEVLPADRRGEARVLLGSAADRVPEAAAGYDLVIAGTHGRTGVARAAFGSVAERTVRLAPCSVLLFPTAALS